MEIMKERIRVMQRHLGVTADGVIGPVTLGAIETVLGIEASDVLVCVPTQAEVRSGRSCFGSPGDEGNLVSVAPPYRLYYEDRPVNSIRVHRLIADRVVAALQTALDHYGVARIRELGLDQYSGSYNYRSTSSGSSLSMHAWGIALDFDAEHNGLKMKKPKARFSAPEYDAWWEAWEAQGAVSLGRECDYDWMHVQFARL